MKKFFTKLCLAFLMLSGANTAMAYDWKFGDSHLQNLTTTGTFKADIENYDWISDNPKEMVIIMDLSNCVKGSRENLFTIAHCKTSDWDYMTGNTTDTDLGWGSSMFLHVDFTNGDNPTFTLRFHGHEYTKVVNLPDMRHVVFTFSKGRGLAINSEDACWVSETSELTKFFMYNSKIDNRQFFHDASNYNGYDYSNWSYAFMRHFSNPNHATYVSTYFNDAKSTGTTELSDRTEYTEDWVKQRLGQEGTYKIMRTFNANTWYTFCSPVDLGHDPFVTMMGNAKVRRLTAFEGNTLVFSEKTDHAFYGEPMLICPQTTVENPTLTQRINNLVPMTVTKTNSNGESVQFVGTWSPATLQTGGKELFLGEGGKFFEPNEGENVMPGLRAYLKLPENVSPQMLRVSIDGVETSISEIENGELLKSCDTRVFNLQGQLMGNSLKGLQPGIYVQGGKKVSVK